MIDWDYLAWLREFGIISRGGASSLPQTNVICKEVDKKSKNEYGIGHAKILCCGEWIHLRPLLLEDTDMIIRWRNSDFVRNCFIYQQDFTHAGHLRWFGEQIFTGKVIQFIVVENGTEKPLGSVYLRDIDREHSKAELGIFLSSVNVCGKGIGTESVRLLVRYAFHGVGLHRVYLRVFADNGRAIAAYQRAGFQIEARLRDSVCIQGEYRDILLMSVLSV